MYLPFVDLGLSFYSLVFLTFFPLCQLFLLDRYWKVTNPGDPLCFAYICHLLFTYTHICFIVNSWPFGFFLNSLPSSLWTKSYMLHFIKSFVEVKGGLCVNSIFSVLALPHKFSWNFNCWIPLTPKREWVKCQVWTLKFYVCSAFKNLKTSLVAISF